MSSNTTLIYPRLVPSGPVPAAHSLPLQGHPNQLVDKTMPPPAFLPRKRKLAPAQSSPSASSASPTPDRDMEDDEYAPAPGSSKRGKGPGAKSGNPGRGMSREQLRKANHSMIERRRREKINAALGELRDMVPDLGGEAKGGEFKLEVLERTVAYMKELKATIAELEARLGRPISPNGKTKSPLEPGLMASPPVPPAKATKVKPHPELPTHRAQKPSTTPPSPSLSPDPNETEPENNLPPAYTVSSRTHTPTIASLLQSANTSAPSSLTRPMPGPQATNPTLYLPFPTPSPTSPFLTYHGASSSSSGSSGPPEPSPFLAPLQGMSLFGGALNLDASAKEAKDMKAEEAANVLLAFSSPDTLKPVIGAGLGMTPKMVPAGGGNRERRLTLESEEFVLDGGVREGGRPGGRSGVVGKTARDILKM